MQPARVLIVEDDPITRAHLASAIERQAGLELAGAVGSLEAARQQLPAACPKVLLVDLGLPDGSGIDLIREATLRDMECMVITVFGDERHVVAALEAGAAGYLLKDSALEDIGSAVLRLLQGESPISPKIARYLVRRFQQTPAAARSGAPATALTERELEVLDAIAKGFSYAEIAHSLSMSPHTVATHVKHIYRKLAVTSRGEAVFEAAHLGLVRMKPD
jgi:DNA-binding NarL/FixJ family response regulator